jgi:hypothetical protein
VDELPRHLIRVHRLVIEGWNHGEDCRPRVGGEAHVADMDFVEWRFAETEHQRATLLKANVGGALDEVARHAVRDSGEGAHAAGHDDHASGVIAAAGNRGSYVVLGVLRNFRGGLAEEFFSEMVAAGDAELFGEDAEGIFRGHKMDAGDAGVGIEGAEEYLAKDDAAGPGEGYGEVFGGGWLDVGGHEEIVRGWRRVRRLRRILRRRSAMTL